jgi:HAD superfamily hydrolase (TIGR01490 family)
MKAAAFFDLDHTLLGANSGALWARRELRLGRISLAQAFEAILHTVLHRLSLEDADAPLRRALAFYRGETEADLARWTREWFREEVKDRFVPGAAAVLEEHRRAGHLRVLLTSSSPYLALVVSEHLGLDAWLSQGYAVEDGRLTGEPVLPLCYGSGKAVYARRFASERGVDLGASYFYTDSYSDLPTLLAVGHPRVVNPDLRLRWCARRRGWPILDWRRAG